MNYNSKKIKKKILNYIKFHQLKFIISFLIILFLFLIYLSIPVIHNYDTYDKVLKNKINQDFKINIKNIKRIEYKFFPQPHFVVHNSIISLTNSNNIAKVDKFNVYVGFKNLHKLNKIQLKKIVLHKTNLKFKFSDLISFNQHLQKKITKPIYIIDSNFFYFDKNEKNILISPIKKFQYFVDYKNKKKYLKTSGILFGTNYKFNWTKDYAKPFFSENYIKFKNLDLSIYNLFENDYEKKYFKGITNLRFLRRKINLVYHFDKNGIEFLHNKENLNNSHIIGKINLNPFYFNLNLDLSNFDLKLIIQKLSLYLYSIESSIHKNVNGNIKINFDKLDNKYFKNLILNLNFQNGKLNFKNTKLMLNKIGKVNILDVEYVMHDNKLFIRSKLELIIDSQDEFYKRLLIHRDNRININKVYFFVKKNIDKNEFFLENIYFNKMPKLDNKKEDIELTFYEIKNFWTLLKKIRSEIKKINLD